MPWWCLSVLTAKSATSFTGTVVGLEDWLRISVFWHRIHIGFGAHVVSHVVGTGINSPALNQLLTRTDAFWDVTPPVQTGPGTHRASYKMCNGSLSGGKAAGAWRWPPTLSSTKVKERVELHTCSSSGPSWPLLGWNLPFTPRRLLNSSGSFEVF